MKNGAFPDINRASASAGEESPFMKSSLARVLGPEKAKKLLEKYITDLWKKIDLLSRHVEEKNTPEIRRIAHQMKGSGKSYGFDFVSETGSALSSSAKKEDFAALRGLVAGLNRFVAEQAKLFE